MTILVVHPGSTVSTADVHAGMVAGLKAHGHTIVNYALHGRMEDSLRHLASTYRRTKKTRPELAKKPTLVDVCYHATLGIYERMLRFQVEAVLVISGVLLPPDTLQLMRRTGVPIGILLTESPYLMAHELAIAKLVDGVWTNERSAVEPLRAVQPRSWYLPHAWLPGVHDRPSDEDAPAHDVVFVGTGFSERIALLEGVDWTGIDLGLYGHWAAVKAKSPIAPFIREKEIPNTRTAALYRKAKIGLNLYRTTMDGRGEHIQHAESLNPRAYELAATGAFHVSTPRAEVGEKFGDLVPTVTTSEDLTTVLRYWLSHDHERQAVAARLPALVAEDTWLARGEQVSRAIRGLRTRAA